MQLTQPENIERKCKPFKMCLIKIKNWTILFKEKFSIESVETYVSIFQFNVKTHYAYKYLLIVLSFIFHGLLTTDHGLDLSWIMT
uniref:Uncharacterized protein n=1 Tax=Helianthus annuus TaxID=4232 RepID=A0A251T6K7_HELAN